VEHPYFNEPGYESDMGSERGDKDSFAYNCYLRLATIKYGMIEQIKNPLPQFESVIKKVSF